jgi:PmbA protein
MMEMMDEIAQETLEMALKYVKEAEIYLEREEKVDVDIQNDQVDFAKEVSSYGLGIRIIQDNKMGFAYTTDLTKLEQTVKNAVFNAKFNVMDENFGFASKSTYPSVKEIYDPKIKDLDVKDTVTFAKNMIQTSLNEKCQPTSGGVSAGSINTVIVNSDGVLSKDSSTFFSGFISVNIPDGTGVSTANESDSSRYLDIDAETIALKACEVARDSRNGKTVETGDMEVILDYNAAAALIYTFSSALNADNVQRGRSVYADKLGEEVLSSSLNVYDDGKLKKGLNSAPSDGEGVPSQKTTLVQNGVLKNFIYDLYTSKRGGVQSTGNGVRSSFADVPSVGFSNLILDFEELNEISNVRNGLIVKDLLGAHTANPISGDFSVETMNAFYIKDGEIAYPVKNAMLSGNVFNALKHARASTMKNRQIGPFILPPIIVSELRVVG